MKYRDTIDAAAARNVGKRIRWGDDGPEGTIRSVMKSCNGYVRYIVDWDPDAPDWWACEVSPRSDALHVLEAGDEHA